MTSLRPISLLTLWLLVAGTAFANPPMPVVHMSHPLFERGETAPVRHIVAPTNGPITARWRFKQGAGSANLIVNPDGTYLFSGSFNHRVPNKNFDIVCALKNKLGSVFLFHYVGNVARGGVQWSKQGRSSILKEDFTLFKAPGTQWAGSYHFVLDAAVIKERALARKAQRAADKKQCEQIAWDFANGWGWEYEYPLNGPPAYCKQWYPNWFW